MSVRQSLLKKYEIPVEHLDFGYVKDCTNVLEVGQMLEILRSGEEGYYHELTKCTEQRLRELDPSHRMLRTEVQCQRTTRQDDVELITFLGQLKAKDHSLRSAATGASSESYGMPPIRSQGRAESGCHEPSTRDRIKSSDYDKWDKYDADTECLKIDLKEEQNRERCLMEDKRQMSKKITEIPPTVALSDTEHRELAEKHRQRGNEYFKCTDFAQALAEYTMSVGYLKTVAALNNRALTYLKLKRYKEAIEDCDKCLMLDDRNVKAMLRKCDGLMKLDRRNEACRVYRKALDIEPNNAVARKAIDETPIRLAIEDVDADQTLNDDVRNERTVAENECDDLQQLIIPKRIVASKASVAMQNFGRFCAKSN